jgi:GNAT superfamily N-acetyltransferase
LENSEMYCGFEINRTKHGEPVLLYKSSGYESDYDVVILFLSVAREDGFRCFQINLIFDEDEMKIADIQVLGEENFNKGYGSLLLQESIEYAKRRGVKKITGDIASDNDKHYERQIAFYTKNGLKILDDKKSIEMLL